MRHPATVKTQKHRHAEPVPARCPEHRRAPAAPRWINLPEFFDDDSTWRDVVVRVARGELIKGRCL